jgi:hypothetical protein
MSKYTHQITHFTRCIRQYFASKHSVFHICGRTGILDATKHYFRVYFYKGNFNIHKTSGNQKAKEKKMFDDIKSKWVKVLGSAQDLQCENKYRINITAKYRPGFWKQEADLDYNLDARKKTVCGEIDWDEEREGH